MSKTLKKTLSIIIAILMIATTMPIAFAADIVDSGYCGASTNDGGAESVTWTLDSTGLLTISGTGAMANYLGNPSPFYNNSDITTIVIKNGVTSIGNYAFRNCTSLESVTIGNSVTSIDQAAFRDCTSLTRVTIPNSVTSIGWYAFADCTSLASITIPDSVTSIGGSAFSSTAYYNDENNWENGVLYIQNNLIEAKEDISGNYSIKPGTKTIAIYAFNNCQKLESVTIPDSVTSIGDGAFMWCESLKSIEIPDSVTSLAGSAFSYCTSIESIIVDEGNESYSSENGVVFNKDKTTLILYPAGKSTSYTIPNSVTSIGEYAFFGCTSLVSIEIPDGVTSIGNQTFYGCTSLASIEIPDSVTSIGYGAFNSCTSLTSVTIPNSVTSIGDWAFGYCTSLASVTISNSVTSIGYSAFNSCESLENITIPDSVTSIGEYAFGSCESLESIEIPDGVTSIGDWAFYNCTSLTLVHYLGTSEQWDKIEIDLFNEALTGATKHYCTQKEKAINATCTEEGKTAVWYCSDCNEDIGGETIKAISHDFENGTCKGCSGTCETLGHSFTNYETTEEAKCGVAGKEEAKCDNGCGATDENAITALEHVDKDGDYICDNGCGHEFEKPATPDEPAANCKHLCHCVDAFRQFIWKIVNFIQKLFSMVLTCN